jgi:hypothetical protein
MILGRWHNVDKKKDPCGSRDPKNFRNTEESTG